MRGDRGAWTASAPRSRPCCTGSSSTRFRRAAVQPRRETQGPGHPPRTRNGDPAAARRIRLARVAITPRTQAAETSQAIVSAASCSCRWCARAARSFVVRRRAGITQECGEHRDRCRVLDSLRETVLGSGAPRIVRAGLPDRGALLVAHGLPGGATVRGRPVRPSRRRCPRVTGRRARAARDGTAPGTVTHSDRSPGLRARPASPADPDRAARTGVLPPVPVKPGARPAGHAHQVGDVRPFIGGLAEREPERGAGCFPRVRSVRRTGRPAIRRRRMQAGRRTRSRGGKFHRAGAGHWHSARQQRRRPRRSGGRRVRVPAGRGLVPR